jgi:hypothetical protein
MGWWSSSDGRGIIGDRPADIFEEVLTDALGEQFDDELFAGFLRSLGIVLHRNPAMLINDPAALDAIVVASFSEAKELRVPLRAGGATGMLEDRLHAALESIGMEYRSTAEGRPPRLAEMLETLAFAARGRIVSAQDGQPLDLLRIVAVRPGDVAEAAASSSLLLWRALRHLLAADALEMSDAEVLVAGGLVDRDWRARLTAVLAVGRLRLAKLAAAANRVDVPGTEVGLDDDERRALLALRDIAPLLAAGQPADGARPVHPDPDVARKRAEFAARVTAAIEGASWPPPSHPAYVLRALAEPDKVRSTAPPHWRGWLTPD